MSWSKVGDFLKDNAEGGVALIGSLLTGNVMGAVSAGASMVMSATGQSEPERALQELQKNPNALLKLKELSYNNEENIRKHLEAIENMRLQDEQKEHETTSNVIVQGQRVAEKGFEKLSRPLMAWVSLLASIGFVFYCADNGVPFDFLVISILSAPCFAWMGLRTLDKRNNPSPRL